MLRNSCARLPNREKVNGYAPEKMAFSLHRWLVNGYAPEKSGILSDYIHFYVLLGTNGYQKEALLALSAADCSPGILNGYAPEYVEGDTIIIDLLTIYDKGEISNITDDFIKYLLDKRKNL